MYNSELCKAAVKTRGAVCSRVMGLCKQWFIKTDYMYSTLSV